MEQAAEIADGAMPTFWSPARVAQSKEWISDGRARSAGLGPFDLTLGLPTFLGDDLEQCRDMARQNLALYTGFPFFRRMWRESGFVTEANRMAAGDGPVSFQRRDAGRVLSARTGGALPRAARRVPVGWGRAADPRTADWSRPSPHADQGVRALTRAS
ncbi:MAG: hypothetical protein QOI10_4352 [Solirubrobacterales bacterium]|nr:hypothetical protein [Solirubrobacterales bacterium]